MLYSTYQTWYFKVAGWSQEISGTMFVRRPWRCTRSARTHMRVAWGACGPPKTTERLCWNVITCNVVSCGERAWHLDVRQQQNAGAGWWRRCGPHLGNWNVFRCRARQSVYRAVTKTFGGMHWAWILISSVSAEGSIRVRHWAMVFEMSMRGLVFVLHADVRWFFWVL